MEIWAVGVVLVLGLIVLWAAKILSRSLTMRARARGSARSRAGRHFVKAAQLLSQAKAGGGNRNAYREAIKEADKAISLDPKDAASYIVKSLALEQLGQQTAALRYMSVALAAPVVRSLTPEDKADALAKRAGMLLDQSRGKKSLQAAIADLEEASVLQPLNDKVLCALGACYERRGSRFHGQALDAYEKALLIDSQLPDARAAVNRLQAASGPGCRRS